MNELGRIVLHDERSRDYPIRRKQLPMRSVRHAMNAANLDQFYLSACVGFAGANALNCAKGLHSRRQFNFVFGRRRGHYYLDNKDGITNYHNATVHDPFDWVYPPTDEGSSAIGLMKFWHQHGIITGYDWAFTFDQFLAALQRQPVLIGTEWFTGMMEPDSQGRVQPAGRSLGGHQYLATEIIWNTRHIGFQNSWGEDWGLDGRFYMQMADISELLANDGDAVAPRFL